MTLIFTIEGVVTRKASPPHSGWLPDGAAIPENEAEQIRTLNLEIQASDSGVFLICKPTDGSLPSDDWFQSIELAQAAAMEKYGIHASQWQPA